jgi:DNA-binding NarL/FixJ family response regulator
MAIHIFDRSSTIAQRFKELIIDAGVEMPVYISDTYEESVSLLREIKARLVLLDINFPGNLSCALVQLIKNINPECRVIILYTFEDELKMKQCLQNGADHLFNKYNEFEKIPAAIKGNL